MRQLIIISFLLTSVCYGQQKSVSVRLGPTGTIDTSSTTGIATIYQNSLKLNASVLSPSLAAKQDTLNIYKPETYGAVGDGVTNDAPAFTAMIAAMPLRGGKVQLATKTYLINSTVTINKAVHFYGNGASHPSYLYSMGTILKSGVDNIVMFRAADDHISFADLLMYNTSTNSTSGCAIRADSNLRSSSFIYRLNIVNVNFWGFYNQIEATGTYGFTISNCFFNFSNYAIKVSNTFAPDAGDSHITGCMFLPQNGVNANTAIYQTSSGGLRITNNKFNWNATQKFNYCYYAEIGGTSDLVIADNSLENYKISAIRVKGVGNIFGNTVITGNQMSGLSPSTRPTITMENVTNVSIVGNALTMQYQTSANDTAILLTNVSYTNIDNSYDTGFVKNVAYSGTATHLKGDGERGKMPPQVTSAQKSTFTPRNSETIYCTDCTATDGSTGVTQTWSSSAAAWKNHW